MKIITIVGIRKSGKTSTVTALIEAIRRKPIPPEKEGMVHAIGLGLLFLLIIIITFKDVVRLFTGG